MNKPDGMCRAAFAAYIQSCTDARVSPTRIMQTLGSAAASRGTHERDGIENGEPYSAALDLSLRRLNEEQIKALLLALWNCGFIAWRRKPPAFSPHIHAVWVACPVKRSLRDQTHSFLARRNGLASNLPDEFTQAHLTEAVEQKLRAAFLAHNPPVD